MARNFNIFDIITVIFILKENKTKFLNLFRVFCCSLPVFLVHIDYYLKKN
jgi:hypothetical protein